MSDILSFVDELLESFTEVENKNQCQNLNTETIPSVSSETSLLEDCLPPWISDENDHSKTKSVELSSGSHDDGHGVDDNILFQATNRNDRESRETVKSVFVNTTISPLTKSAVEGLQPGYHHHRMSQQQQQQLKQSQSQSITNNSKKAKENNLIIAARNRLKREKLKSKIANSNSSSNSDIVKISKPTNNLDHDNSKECKNELSKLITDGEASTSTNTHTNSILCNNLQEKEIEGIAYKCLDMFMKEVKEFSDKCKGDDEKIIQHATTFANFLQEKYIELSLNLLPSTNDTVSKVKKLISSFVDKCKDSPIDAIHKLTAIVDGGSIDASGGSGRQTKKRGTWQCILCGKKGQPLKHKKCITCGRPRGYRERDYTKDIQKKSSVKEEKIFISGSEYVQKLKESDEITIDERKKQHYLYNKKDFETDSRLELKSDISDLLSSIRDFTT